MYSATGVLNESRVLNSGRRTCMATPFSDLSLIDLSCVLFSTYSYFAIRTVDFRYIDEFSTP